MLHFALAAAADLDIFFFPMADDASHITMEDLWKFLKSRPPGQLWSALTALASVP
jgi:hypothetical protein